MTQLIYLKDTYLFDTTALIEDIVENDRGVAIILNQTIFYPQGGGQPADTGMIFSADSKFLVNDVRLNENGIVFHYGEFEKGSLQKTDKVELKIEQHQRIINARIHSAGHLLDCAVDKMNLDQLVPTKGFHFKEGPYVEYEGVIENGAALIPELEKTINELIKADIILENKSLNAIEAKELGIWAPPGKSARVVNFKGFPYCGCGGTHISSTKEIGKVIVRKIKSKKGKTRIAYALV